MRKAAVAFACLVGAAAATAGRAPPFTTEVERCIVPAAEYHQVNPFLLRAILVVESGLNPRAVNRNSNSTVDVGIGQENSMHFRELAQYGIAPDHLRDACVGTYVSAWELKKVIVRHGNTWEAIARYHSATPKFNRIYQAKVYNELVRSGAIVGPLASVPSAGPTSGGRPRSPSALDLGSMVVYDR